MCAKVQEGDIVSAGLRLFAIALNSEWKYSRKLRISFCAGNPWWNASFDSFHIISFKRSNIVSCFVLHFQLVGWDRERR